MEMITSDILETAMPEKRPLCSLPPTYAPSLVFSDRDKRQDHTFYTLFDEGSHVRSIPEMHGTRCLASCYGWLMLQRCISTDCYLFNPVSLVKIQLPPILDSSFLVGTLSSTPSDPNCFAVIYGERLEGEKSIIFCRIGDTKWIEQPLVNSEFIRYECDEAISCNGKVYLLFFHSIAIVDVHNGDVASVELYEQKFLGNSIPGAVCHDDFIVESCGEIFKVLVIKLGELDEIIRKCDVYKLDFSTMDWIKVESLGHRIFLLGETGSTSFSTDGLLGVKGNRIYITLSQCRNMYMFDMDDGTVTYGLPCPKEFSHGCELFWLVPDCKFEVDKGIVAKLVKSRSEVYQHMSWMNLPMELLESILSSLSLDDCIRFRLTCKNWIPVTPPLKSIGLQLDFTCGSQNIPWLVSLPNISMGVCNLYHPIFGDAYTVNLPELEGAIIRDAKYGWLLMSKGYKTIFFFNPFNRKIIQLPDLKSEYQFMGLTFSAPPTSADCTVFGYDRSSPEFCTMHIYCMPQDSEHNEDSENNGENEDHEDMWYECTYKNKFEFMAADCNPVFHNGVFYCLSIDGKLGIFNPDDDLINPEETGDGDDLIWCVLEISPIFTYSAIEDFQDPINRSYLVEEDGDILSVFVDFRGDPVLVYKLDQSEEKNLKWVKLNDLGDKSLFVSVAASMLVPMDLKGIENRIYFSKLHEENCGFYSFSTGRYQCFRCIYCDGDCKSVREHANCTWMQLQD